MALLRDDGTYDANPPPIEQLQRCHDAGRKLDPEHAGGLFVHVHLGDGGEVIETKDVRSKGLPAATVECLVTAVKTTTFRPPDGGSLSGTLYVGLR